MSKVTKVELIVYRCEKCEHIQKVFNNGDCILCERWDEKIKRRAVQQHHEDEAAAKVL